MHEVKIMSMSTVTTTKAISTAARSRCHYHRLRYINKRKSLYSASFAEFSFLRPEVIACSSPGRFLSSSNKNNGIPSKYLTNGGTIEGVWVFHRHGDRAPNRYLGSDTYLDAESDHWHSRIPSRSDGISGPYLKNKFLASATPSKTITTAATTTAYQALSNYFPPSIHPSQNNGLFLDVDREPFGFLTWRGMDQMRGVGQKMRRRYERFGYRVDGTSYSGSGSVSGQQTATPPSSSSSESSSSSLLPSNNYSFLDHWNVQAYSTNYLRTVMSVQCFLDGLIAKQREVNCTTISNEHNKTNAMDNSTTASASSKATETMKGSYIKAGGGLPRYYKDVAKHEQLTHVDTSTLTTMEDMKPISNNVIKVQVRDKVVDTLNAFDRFPQMMNGLVRDVIATEQFQRIDSAAKPLAEQLSQFLPGLAGAPQAFGGTPSGINWIHANDHFVCRHAHSIPLLAFSDIEGKPNEKDVEAILASMAIPVLSHLAWRFREWYRCPRLLAAVAAPPLKEVMRHMMDTVANSTAVTPGGAGDRRPFVTYSCHDVTLISLLYGIGADFLVSGEDCGGGELQEEDVHLGMDDVGKVRDGAQKRESWRWWPAYSSTIVFELVRVEECDSDGVDGYVIRVILNGETLRIIPRLQLDDEGILKEQTVCSRQRFGERTEGGECQMLQLPDFSQMIYVLEQAGVRSTSPEEGSAFGTKEESRWQG